MRALVFVFLLVWLNSQAQTMDLDIEEAPYTTYKKVSDIVCPKNFERAAPATNSFAAYLRRLSIKQENNLVMLHDGTKKINQDAQFAVIKMDVGKRDLQQCADAVMRLRAEYLWEQKRYSDIHFNFTNGKRVDYTKYAGGFRMKIKGNRSDWVKQAKADWSHQAFRRYMDLIFAYAGTASLEKELKPVGSIQQMQIGDVFILGGFPGHAVIVIDMASDTQGNKIFMLAQSYMPAQEIHILKNPVQTHSPWYHLKDGQQLVSPEYLFPSTALRRF